MRKHSIKIGGIKEFKQMIAEAIAKKSTLEKNPLKSNQAQGPLNDSRYKIRRNYKIDIADN